MSTWDTIRDNMTEPPTSIELISYLSMLLIPHLAEFTKKKGSEDKSYVTKVIT